MSGPLASYVGKHSEGGWRAVLVVKELALVCRSDGRPVEPVTRDQLCDRTRVGMTTIRHGLDEARDLGRAGKRGGIVVLQQGGGRGWASLYRVLVDLCPAEADCRECDTLRSLLRSDRPEQTGRQAPRSRGRPPANRAPRDRNRTRGGSNRAPGAPQTETGDGSPTPGGTVTYPESAAPAPSQDSGAAEPEQATKGSVVIPDWWSVLHPGRPRPSSPEARVEEEQAKRARAAELLADGRIGAHHAERMFEGGR
jgi:hypothetical protein